MFERSIFCGSEQLTNNFLLSRESRDLGLKILPPPLFLLKCFFFLLRLYGIEITVYSYFLEITFICFSNLSGVCSLLFLFGFLLIALLHFLLIALLLANDDLFFCRIRSPKVKKWRNQYLRPDSVNTFA